MLYPKIKKKKISIKTHFINFKDDIRSIFYKIIKIIIDKDYFILFMKKKFHF